jgi:hypothetical protein
MDKVSVLLMGYNRPAFIEAQLKLLLKQSLVKKIYVSIDGYKKNATDKNAVDKNTTDKNAVALVVEVVLNYQKKFPGKIKTQFGRVNLGCRRGVEAGINWFFTHEKMGIILEDDCVPNSTFFSYAHQLLKKYETDQRVGMISGTNPLEKVSVAQSYIFSNQSIVWGWASWSDRWLDYQKIAKLSSQSLEDRSLYNFLLTKTSKKHLQVIGKVLDHKVDTWDYIWYLTNLVQSRFCIIPQQNLISNHGFGESATHTKVVTSQSRLPQYKLKLPLHHPAMITTNDEFEKKYLGMIKPISLMTSIVAGYFKKSSSKN